MKTSTKSSFAIAMTLAAILMLAGESIADVPFPATSTCAVTITQFPTRPACVSDWEPDVARLTPAGSNAAPLFDRVSITVRVRDASDVVVPGALVSFRERDPARTLNVANGGATTAVTDGEGLATVMLHAASGNGPVTLCADGVPLCNLDVRSPDVEKCGITTICGIGTASSSVSGCDITHAMCGFLVNFGAVTVGVNDGYDLDCSWSVSGPDITGSLGKGGVLQYFGDIGTLGARNSCP